MQAIKTVHINNNSGEGMLAQQFDLLVQSVDDIAVFAIDPLGYIVSWNTGAENFIGYKEDDISGRHISFFYTEKDVLAGLPQQHITNAGEGNFKTICYWVTANKTEFSVAVSFTGYYNAAHEIEYYSVIVRRIGNEKNSETVYAAEEYKAADFNHSTAPSYLLNASSIKDLHLFYDMFMQAPTAICVLRGRDFVFEMANPYCIQHAGKTALVGRSIKEVYPELESQGFLKILDNIYKTGEPFEGKEMPIKVMVNGKMVDRYLNFIYKPFSNAKGEVEYILYFGIDVTEQVLAAQKLKNTTQKIERIYERVNEGVYTKDVINNKYLHLSVGCPKIYGYTVEEFFANPMLWFEVIHPDDKNIIGYENDQLKKGEPVHSRYRIIHKDKSIRWIEIKAFPVIENGVFTQVEGIVYDVTDRKVADEKLEHASKELQWLFDNVEEMLISVDMTTFKNINISPACENIYGYTAEEFYADDQLWVNCIYPADLWVLDYKHKKFSANKVASSQFRIIHKDGSIRWVEDMITPTLDEAGKLLRIDGILRDITNRKKSEQLINDSEEKRRLIMNAALDAIICINTKGLITFWNPQSEKIFGWKEDEVMGVKLSEIIIPSPYNLRHDTGMENYLKTGHGPALNVLLELTAINRQKKQFPIELTVLPIKQGEEEFFCAFIRDISLRKENERDLLTFNERFKRVSKATHDAVYDWDLLTDDFWVNENFYKLMGYDPSKPIPDFDEWALSLHDNDRQRITTRLKDIKETTVNKWEDEFSFKLKDGKYRTVLERAYVLRDNQNKPIRLINALMDITERRKQEEEIKFSREELRRLASHLQTVREEERADISREVHDELGQLLTALKMDLQIIKKRLPLQDEIIKSRITESEKLAEEIIFSVRRIASQLRPPMLDQLGLKATLQWYSNDFSMRTGIQCFFKEHCDDEIKDHSIGIGIFRVFQEALTNITRHSAATEVNVDFMCNGIELQLAIQDNGIGFNKNEVREKNRLGLLGMQERVQILKGELVVESTPGDGAILKIKIPLA